MLIAIPDVLSPAAAAAARLQLEQAVWIDGRATAGHQGAHVKNNRQLPPDNEAGRQIGGAILEALGATPLFMSAALPLHVLAPTFNRYGPGEAFGDHIDGAVRFLPNGQRMRTDLSCTLFLSEPDSYEGGELIVEDPLQPRAVKLPAGHMILYPSSTVHRVAPVTRGERISAFFWLQSLVRETDRRGLLFNMDVSIQALGAANPVDPNVVRLTGAYHNLLRMWGEV